MCGPVRHAAPTLRSHRLRVRSGPHDLELAYHVAGHGSTIVLLVPGMCVSHHMWRAQAQHLLRDSSRYTLILPDPRGTGHSAVDRRDYGLADLAHDVWAVADAAAPGCRVHLVGHSMGSMVVQRAALLKPRRVASLAVLGGHDGGWYWRFVPTVPMVRAALHVVAARFDPVVSAAAFIRLHYTPGFLDGLAVCGRTGAKRSRRDVLLDRYLAPEHGAWSDDDGDAREGCYDDDDYDDDSATTASSTSTSSIATTEGSADHKPTNPTTPAATATEEEAEADDDDPTFWRHLAAARQHALSPAEARALRELQCPKLAVYGRRDRVVLPRASRELAARIGADVVGVDAAHFLFDEAAADVNHLLELHLARACGGGDGGEVEV